jgi:hypothetical protein
MSLWLDCVLAHLEITPTLTLEISCHVVRSLDAAMI